MAGTCSCVHWSRQELLPLTHPASVFADLPLPAHPARRCSSLAWCLRATLQGPLRAPEGQAPFTFWVPALQGAPFWTRPPQPSAWAASCSYHLRGATVSHFCLFSLPIPFGHFLYSILLVKTIGYGFYFPKWAQNDTNIAGASKKKSSVGGGDEVRVGGLAQGGLSRALSWARAGRRGPCYR